LTAWVIAWYKTVDRMPVLRAATTSARSSDRAAQ
jgi:hypothetical protein